MMMPTRATVRYAALFAAGLFLLTAPAVAFAAGNPLDSITGFIVNLINSILQFVFVGLADLVLHVAASLFDWVMSPQFNQIPLTHGLFVNTGWTLVRDFANMFFIVILIIMAFGTILGVENYSWRRLLPKMIAAALLINFTKFFAGVTVDIANIVILFFIQNGIQNADPNRGIATQLADVMGLAKLFSSNEFLQNTLHVSSTESASLGLVSTIIQIIFLWSAAITMLLLALTMITRIIRIWLLVIIAPLAVVAAVLDFSQGFWKYWIKDFFKWAIMGVNITAMVYFAALLAQALILQSDLGGYINAFAATQGGGKPDLSIFTTNNFIGQATPLLMFFLIIGLLNQGRKFAAEGAGEAGGVALKAIQGVQQRLGARAKKAGLATGRLAYNRGAQRLATSNLGKRAQRGLDTMKMAGIPLISYGAGVASKRITTHQVNNRGRVDEIVKELETTKKTQGKDAMLNQASVYITKGAAEFKAAAALMLDKEGKLTQQQLGEARPSLERFGRDREITSLLATTSGVPRSLGPQPTPQDFNSLSRSMMKFSEAMEGKNPRDLSHTELSNKYVAIQLGLSGYNSIMSDRNVSPEKKRNLRTGVDALKMPMTDREVEAIARGMGTSEDDVKELIKQLITRNNNMLSHADNRFTQPTQQQPPGQQQPPPSQAPPNP